MPSRRRQQFRSAVRHMLAVETLETRAMMAGNVTASVSGGTLIIKGDISANEIMISQTSATTGAYTITPIAGSSTTINSGAVAVNFLNVVRFDIKMNGGDDKVGIGNDLDVLADLFDSITDDPEDEPEAGLLAESEEENTENDPEIVITTLFGDDEEDEIDLEDPEFTAEQMAVLPTKVRGLTSVDLGDGNDMLVAMVRSTSNLVVAGGKGSDAVLSILTSVGNIAINTDPSKGEGMGDDLAAVVMSNVRSNLAITTEGGNDGVLVLASSVTNFGVNAGGPATVSLTDNDFVMISSLYAADNVGVQTEVGDDGIYVDDLIADTIQVASGFGDDEVSVTSSSLLNLVIDTSAGEDWVTVGGGNEAWRPTTIRRNLVINSGADDDLVEIDGGLLGLLVGGSLDVRTGTGDDMLLLNHVNVSRNALIEMDAGNDSASINGLDVQREMQISLSAGNDVLTVRSLSSHKIGIRGGTGNDTLHDLGNHNDDLTGLQFETTDNGSSI
jgi:hypothetical protein